jgi:predicted esterase
MNSLLASTSSLVLLCVVTLVGCSDDEAPSDPAGSGAAASGGSGPGGSGGAGAKDPYEAVPPEPLAADPAVDCPAPYDAMAPAPGDNDGYPSAGQNREFWLILPEASYEGPRPLFVAFNGTNESGESFSERARLTDFAARGFVVLAPSSAGNGTLWPIWDAMHEPGTDPADNKDLATFDSMVRCVAAHHPVDKHRIYIGGHSAGGIMSNYVLQRRSELLAGGIVASGVMSLTTPTDPKPLDEMMVLVTWGGDDDEYSGGTSEVQVPTINFVEQASLASVFYDEEPAVGQAHCSGDFGHAWLDPINDWMVDLLLQHPKSLGSDAVELAPTPADSGVTCSSDPFVFEGDLVVSCPTTSVVAGCAEACQLVADCGVENATVGPILAPQLTQLGFSGADNQNCAGCVPHCEAVATTTVDAAVLECMQTQAEAAACGPGIDGALPLIDAINACCDGQLESAWCDDVCTIMSSNSAAFGFLSACKAFVP